jgi:hypothetical protein
MGPSSETLYTKSSPRRQGRGSASGPVSRPWSNARQRVRCAEPAVRRPKGHLHGMPFEDGARPARRHNTRQRKSCAVEQCPIFRFGPLASAAVDEPHIEKLVRVRFVWRFRYPSKRSKRPSGPILRLQFTRIVNAAAASHSWITRLRRYASPSAGTVSKKSPATISQRSAISEARRASAPATTLGGHRARLVCLDLPKGSRQAVRRSSAAPSQRRRPQAIKPSFLRPGLP